jgi:two-component system sensor histidine kinase BaeS
MALTLEKNERERRQWVADISHELRTPISVLQGEIEALMDGIRTVTPETIHSLHAETLRLKHLVEDLYQISLSDLGALTYRKDHLDLLEVLRDSVESYRAEFDRKNISLTISTPRGLNAIGFADRERLNQLFFNLLENSLRYTDTGGKLFVETQVSNNSLTIEFRDSEPGVPVQDRARLFERFYRVEGSRSRESGGAGLGLTICKNIVDAHEGTISAHESPLGGLLIRVVLPVSGVR